MHNIPWLPACLPMCFQNSHAAYLYKLTKHNKPHKEKARCISMRQRREHVKLNDMCYPGGGPFPMENSIYHD